MVELEENLKNLVEFNFGKMKILVGVKFLAYYRNYSNSLCMLLVVVISLLPLCV